MADALYGPAGFYLTSNAPARNFRTSAHTSPAWPTAVLDLATRIDASLGSPESFAIVDVGAGGGELLTSLAASAPPQWSLCGVDLAPRPAALPARVTWTSTTPDGIDGLLIANELLDVVPIDVVELAEDGPRLLGVSSTGEETVGDLAEGRDAEWLRAWWSLVTLGDRAEIGWPRDEAWRALTSRLRRGVAVAIDYAALPSRDRFGTLTGYRAGRQVPPVPDGSRDLTAHVRFESMTVDGDVVLTQREALRSLGVDGHPPAYRDKPSHAHDPDDALAYLAALSCAGEAAELLDLGGLGGFTWLVHPVDAPNPFADHAPTDRSGRGNG
jgi:SAM-dependent MidA family methyltransferase